VISSVDKLIRGRKHHQQEGTRRLALSLFFNFLKQRKMIL
jgi:hypothetical protein